MTNERWQKFHDEMVTAGVYENSLSVHSAYTLEFVNQGVGLDLKKELTGE
ncbi:hypothetical protein [Parvibaculum sp.]